MHSFPLITIIVAVKNGEKTIQRTIDSICRQTHSNKEMIIIDGDSADATVDIIKQNASDISYWESKKDKGVYHAWNKALDHASGEWICFLGADDFFWDVSCLSRMCHYLYDSYPKTRIVYGSVNLVTDTGEIIYSIGKPWKQLRKKFFQFDCLPHPGLMHHRSIFEDHGKFDDSFIIAGDYELLLRELVSSNARYVPLTMVGMQHGGLSTLAGNSITALKEMRRALRRHGIYFPGVYWSLGIIKAYLMLAFDKVVRKQACVLNK